MVLVLNGVLQQEWPTQSRDLYAAHPVYRDTANQLLTSVNKIVGSTGLIYVQQREMAATAPHDRHINFLGSDDATSCIIVVVRHSGSGAVALGHLDGSGTDEAVSSLVAKVQELAVAYTEGRIELQLVGGVAGPHRFSEDLFAAIMHAFHRHPMEIDLTLACVGELNTVLRGGIMWPAICGIAVNVRTGEIFPATFPDKGPDTSLRIARYLAGSSPQANQVVDIYDISLGMLRIGPFNYDPLRGVDLWLEQSDEFILQHLSTSPQIERPHFVTQIRNTFKYIQDNQFPAVTVFRDNRPHYYRMDEHTGCWQPVRY